MIAHKSRYWSEQDLPSLYQTWTVLGEASTLHLILTWPPMGTPWSWCWTLMLGATKTTLSPSLVLEKQLISGVGIIRVSQKKVIKEVSALSISGGQKGNTKMVAGFLKIHCLTFWVASKIAHSPFSERRGQTIRPEMSSLPATLNRSTNRVCQFIKLLNGYN